MSQPIDASKLDNLNDENRRIWDANAEWWDDKIGDGNDFQRELIEPPTERLLSLSPGEHVLDIACGAGRLARRLAELGAHVTGLDYSQRFIERAKQRTGGNDAIRYEVLDATDEDALRSLGENQFDAAVCTMALMDIVTIDPIMRSLAYLLKPGARFVYSILHPCFHSAEMVKFAEMAEVDGRIMVKTGVKVTRYLTPFVVQTYGIVGQPEAQYLFHRPLSQLFQASFAAGFIIDGCEEPRLTAVAEKAPGLRWRDLPEIPPVLVVRLRKPN